MSESIIGEVYTITYNGRKYYILDVGTGAYAFTQSIWKKLDKSVIRKEGLFGKVMKIQVPHSLKTRAYNKYLSLLRHPTVVKRLNQIYNRRLGKR